MKVLHKYHNSCIFITWWTFDWLWLLNIEQSRNDDSSYASPHVNMCPSFVSIVWQMQWPKTTSRGKNLILSFTILVHHWGKAGLLTVSYSINWPGHINSEGVQWEQRDVAGWPAHSLPYTWLLFYIAQGHLSRDNANHSGLSPPASINNQDNAHRPIWSTQFFNQSFPLRRL